AKYTFLAAQVSNPFPVSPQVAVTGMAETARMGMHDAQNGQALVRLTHDSAAQRLADAIEAHVGGAGIALVAGWQGGPGDALDGLSECHEDPASFLFAAGRSAMGGILLEKRASNAVREQQALQRLIANNAVRCRGTRRLDERAAAEQLPAQVFEELAGIAD